MPFDRRWRLLFMFIVAPDRCMSLSLTATSDRFRDGSTLIRSEDEPEELIDGEVSGLPPARSRSPPLNGLKSDGHGTHLVAACIR